jgi:hypothetical protein
MKALAKYTPQLGQQTASECCTVWYCTAHLSDRGDKKTEVANRVAQIMENFIQVEFAIIPFRVKI